MIQEENISWSGMVEDFNTVDQFKSEVVASLNKYENIWSSTNVNYKPFISYGHGGSTNEELNSSFNGLDIQDDRQIADQYPFYSIYFTNSKITHHTYVFKSIFLN